MLSTSKQRSSFSGSPRRDLERASQQRKLPRALVFGAVVAFLAAALAITYVILAQTSVFAISIVEAEGTEHMSSETIANLADVAQGTTLLNVDEDQVRANLMRNPWVQAVDIEKEFPDKMRIVIHEREIGYLVLMGSNAQAWNLGTDGVWIEPATFDVPEGGSTSEVALAKAAEDGAYLVVDIPSTVSPKAGEVTNDACVSAVLTYVDRLSDSFAADIVSFAASSEQALSCTLRTGVQISLGEPSDISTKERVIQEILSEYLDQVTYINVRVPNKPTFRKVGTESVQAGTGTSVGVDGDVAADAQTQDVQTDVQDGQDVGQTDEQWVGDGADGAGNGAYADGGTDADVTAEQW